MDHNLVQPHWWLDDLDLVTSPALWFRYQQHVGKQEAVDVGLEKKIETNLVLFYCF